MREQLQLLLSKISRLLSNEDIAFKVYLSLGAAVVLTVGLFGIVPGVKAVYENFNLVREMKTTNAMLNKKIQDLETAKTGLDNIGNNLSYLEYNLPTNFDIQNYMIVFVFVAGDSNYVVDRFSPYNSQGNAVEILITLIGKGDLSRLITNLEKINRISEVEDIRLKRSDAYDEITLRVRTFIMENLSADK